MCVAGLEKGMRLMCHTSLSALEENEILLIKNSAYILSTAYPQYKVFS